MGKTLVVAEKPDQARSYYLPMLQTASGEKFEKRNGYYESKSFYLTWFFGHLLEALMPDEYDAKYKEWKIEHLPIIPSEMKYKYKKGAREQGQTIAKLCRECTEIICGTDPDREGQGIFDTFMRFNKVNVPMRRLWATSLTEKDLKKAWDRMKDLREYKNLSIARELRSDSDWLVGMNASRAYSIIGKAHLPIGRVLTATLALIVKKDEEVENYKESFYYQLKGTWNGIEFTYFDENGTKFDSKEVLERVIKVIKGKVFSLSEMRTEMKIENPPKTFNLPDLQKEANRKFGFSLDKTLALAQSLYEKKLATYPRTDSPYLPESDLQAYHTLVRMVAKDDEIILLRTPGAKPPCVKDTDSPHTALIVTGETGAMTGDEKTIYELIRARFVCAFMVPRTYEQVDLEISNKSGEKFKATLRHDRDAGFRKLYKDDEEKEEGVQHPKEKIDYKSLKGREEPLSGEEIVQYKKARPKYYTGATLITAMQTCGRTLENEDARKTLAETKGIGTPATQAIYPRQLQKYGYIIDHSNSYISTPKGRKLIKEIGPDLKTPELTADWEMKLKQIEQGTLAEYHYRHDLEKYIRKIIEDAKERSGKMNFNGGEATGMICPNCATGMLKKGWGYGCEKKCGFSIGYKFCGKTLTDKQIITLLSKGKTAKIAGFISPRTGKPFDATLAIQKEKGRAKVGFVF